MYRLNTSAIRWMLLRQDYTPDSLICSLILGLGIGLLGRAPLWPLILTYVAFTFLHLSPFRSLARMRARRQSSLDRWRSFEVSFGADRVVVRSTDGEESIARSEIARIVEVVGDGLWIYSNDRRVIYIPSLLTGYSELKTTLAAWVPIRRGGSMQLWRLIGLPAPLAIFVSALLVRSRYVFFPLVAFAGFYLLRFAWISIKYWSRWRKESRVPEVPKDPLWVPAIPFFLLGLLVLKCVWMV